MASRISHRARCNCRSFSLRILMRATGTAAPMSSVSRNMATINSTSENPELRCFELRCPLLITIDRITSRPLNQSMDGDVGSARIHRHEFLCRVAEVGVVHTEHGITFVLGE